MTSDATEPQLSATADRPPVSNNVFARLAGVLFAPAETFQAIARRPNIVAPMLLFLALGYASTLLIIPRLDLETLNATQAEQFRKQNPKMSDADLERMQRFAAASTKVTMWLSPLFMLVFYVIVAGALLAAFRLMEGEGTFEQALSATLYAWTPMLLFSIVSTIVVVAQGSFDPVTAATLVKSNPAFLVDLKEQPLLYALLSSLDVFSIWTLVMFVFAFSALSKLSTARSTAIVVTLWLVIVGVKLGFAALGAAAQSA
jgi:hypothetical protein